MEARGPVCAGSVVLGTEFGFYGESTEGPWENFFHVYFEKMIDSQEAAKIVRKSPVYPLSSAPQW